MTKRNHTQSVNDALKRIIKFSRFNDAVGTIVVALFAVFAGVVLIAFLSNDPSSTVRLFLLGSFDGKFRIGTALALSTPLLFTGAAVVVASRAGIFNLGVEGQMYFGAAMGTWVATSQNLPGFVVILLSVIGGALAGAAFAALPGYLKAFYQADLVVMTLMLNFVSIKSIEWLVNGPLRDESKSNFPQSKPIPGNVELPRLLEPSSLHLGFILGIIICFSAHFLLMKTSFGLRFRIVGENSEFARYVGIQPYSRVFIGMLVSGMIGGLGGALHILGDQHRLVGGFSPGYGFTGVLIAVLARNNFLLVPVAAICYSWILSGAQIMEESTDVPREAVSVIQAILFFLITSTVITQWIQHRSIIKRKGDL